MARARFWLLVPLCLACTPKARTSVPTHEELVNDHLAGRYAEVITWCPRVLENGESNPAIADWCMFGYPAALHLGLDSKASLGFVRTVCQDITGQPKGEQAFREFYVEESARWIGLPLRMQGRERELDRALSATIESFAELCSVDAGAIRRHVDTSFKTRRELREQSPAKK